MRTSCALVIILLLAACGTTQGPSRVIVEKVEVPVAVKCATDPGPAPAYADTDAALKGAPDLYEKVRLLLVGRLQRIMRELELEASISGCK